MRLLFIIGFLAFLVVASLMSVDNGGNKDQSQGQQSAPTPSSNNDAIGRMTAPSK